MRRRERGVSLAIFLVVFALVMVAFLATYALSRLQTAGDDRVATTARLQAAAAALEQFAAVAQRLPCPADPALSSVSLPPTETGEEVRNGSNCTHGEGTVPWKTIGLRRDQAYDAWGRKISYRVYTGSAGSLVQDGGVSMVYCDTVDPGSGAREAGTGLCRNPGTEFERSTTPERFLANKGLSLTDLGIARNDTAYVLISHGATGLGAFTASGARIEMPTGVERGNTRENGAFTIMAFSDAETSAKAGAHFDDVIAYRTLPDLVSRIKLGARNWPDLAVSSLTFDQATVGTAVGNASLGTGGTGATTIDFGSASAAGRTTGVASQVSFDTVGGVGGIGVIGTGSSTKMTYFEGESLTITFDDYATRLGITLADFGTYDFFFGSVMTEHVVLRFFNGTTAVGAAVTKAACAADGGLANLEVDVGANFNSVTIAPAAATGFLFGFPFTWDSQFLLSALKACSSGSNCRTDLWSSSTACP